jgi:ribosomal protein S18 acetylase RimI-like enzyme
MRLLIDADLLADLEPDERPDRQFAKLEHICARNGVDLYLHPISQPSATAASAKNTLATLPGSHAPSKADIEQHFGPCSTDEGLNDATLLDAVRTKIADYVVSNDAALHALAASTELDALVFTVDDALAWALRSYELEYVPLSCVSKVVVGELELSGPILDELREEYAPDFDKWTRKISDDERKCWIVRVDGQLAALVIRKDETHAEAKTKHPGPDILKISTFKVAEAFRGRKLGEQLVKQILWFAQKNDYDLVYLTAYPKQKSLRLLLEAYGFVVAETRTNGEMVLEKAMVRGPVSPRQGENALAASCRSYPNFVCGAGVSKYVIPIRPAYHAMLFPEFGSAVADPAVEILGKPANTIEKVYLCHSPTKTMNPGDVILFYLSKQAGTHGSQSLTTVGVVKSVRWSNDIDEVRRWTAKRSVYPDSELIEMASRTTPLLIIDFLLVGHLTEVVPISALTARGILSSFPQSIVRIEDDAFDALKRSIDLGFEF